MNKEDLKKLGLTDETVMDQIIVLHGKDIETHKGKLATLQTEADGYKNQLADATKTIEGFKGMDIEGVKKSAEEWKTKAEAAQTEAAAQVAKLKFDHALEKSLLDAKAKNPKAVTALLNTELLKLADDGSISGLNDQLTKIKTENDYLFQSDTQTPEIVLGGNNQSINLDSVLEAAKIGAGLPTKDNGK
jgi:hypothetical protein